MTEFFEQTLEKTSAKEIRKQVLNEKECDALCPGFEVILTQDEADELGAFAETALSYEEAKLASAEILEMTHESEFNE